MSSALYSVYLRRIGNPNMFLGNLSWVMNLSRNLMNIDEELPLDCHFNGLIEFFSNPIKNKYVFQFP